MRVPRRDLVLEGGRDEDVAVDLEDLDVGDVRRAGEALDRAVLLLPADDLGDIETVRGVDATGQIRDRHDRRAFLGDEPSRDQAGIAEALDRDLGLLQVDRQVIGGLDDAEHSATRGRLIASPRRPPRLMGLPVTTPGTV